MRILVTGAANPFGRAIAEALLDEGHHVRLFAVGADAAHALHAPDDRLTWFPGDVGLAGSIEPALSERQAIVHAACLDLPGKDRRAHAIHVERGTLYTRYGAEREQVDHFVHLAPAGKDRAFGHAQETAVATVNGLRGSIQRTVVIARTPEQAARDVLQALASKPLLGKQPGRENDAVTT